MASINSISSSIYSPAISQGITTTAINGSSSWVTSASSAGNYPTVSVSGDMSVSGTLTLGGVNLDARLKKIEDRLGIMTVSYELEAEFNELKEMGDKYRELEARMIKKAAAIKKLSA